jgi:ribosomal-protein-alanine N-acetyltransferase
MSGIKLRKMQPHDIRAVMEIEQASFTAPWSELSFLNEMYNPGSLAKVALIENRVVGYSCSRYVLNEGHLLNLAVHHDFRRRGVATELMNNILVEFKEKDCTLLYLEVRVSNLDAIKFYERFGFKVASFRRKYYTSPTEDGALMMRWL